MAAALRVWEEAEVGGSTNSSAFLGKTNCVSFWDEQDIREAVAVPNQAQEIFESTEHAFSPTVDDLLDLRLEERLWELGPSVLQGHSVSRLKSSTYSIGDMEVFLKLIDDQVTVYAGGSYHELGAWLQALRPALPSPIMSNESDDDTMEKDGTEIIDAI